MSDKKATTFLGVFVCAVGTGLIVRALIGLDLFAIGALVIIGALCILFGVEVIKGAR